MTRRNWWGLALVGIWTSTAWGATLLGRSPGSRMLGPQPIWTNGTTTAIFHPMGAPVSSAGMVNVRVAFQLSEISGACRARPALRFSNDGVTWGSDVAIDAANLPYTANDTPVYGTAYVDVLALGVSPGSWVQFGMQAANTGATSPGFCNATLRLEEKEK